MSDTPMNDAERLELVRIKAQAGLCAMTFDGARAFLKDIMELTAGYDLFDRIERERAAASMAGEKG